LEFQQQIVKINHLINQTRVQEEQLISQVRVFEAKFDDLREDGMVIQKETEAVAVRLSNFTRRLEELTIQKRSFEDKINQLVSEKEVIDGVSSQNIKKPLKFSPHVDKANNICYILI